MTITIYENDEVVDTFEAKTEAELLAYYDEHYGLGDFDYKID